MVKVKRLLRTLPFSVKVEVNLLTQYLYPSIRSKPRKGVARWTQLKNI